MDITGKVIDEISLQLGIDEERIKVSNNLETHLGMDESDRMEIVFDLEEDLNIEIPDETILSWVTVEDIITTVEGIYEKSRAEKAYPAA